MEVIGVLTHRAVLVVGVDELALESFQEALNHHDRRQDHRGTHGAHLPLSVMGEETVPRARDDGKASLWLKPEAGELGCLRSVFLFSWSAAELLVSCLWLPSGWLRQSWEEVQQIPPTETQVS